MNGYTQKGVTLERNGGDANPDGTDVGGPIQRGRYWGLRSPGISRVLLFFGKCDVANALPPPRLDGSTVQPVGFLRQSVNLGSRDMLANVVTMGQVKWQALTGRSGRTVDRPAGAGNRRFPAALVATL